MLPNVYAVVGGGYSGRTAVSLDLAGAFAAGGETTALLELDAEPPYLQEMLELSIDFVLRTTTDQLLAGGSDPTEAVTRIRVEGSGVESLGIVPAGTGGGSGEDGDLPLSGLRGILEGLAGDYDAVVLDVSASGVGSFTALSEPANAAVVTTRPEEGAVRDAAAVIERLEAAAVVCDGVVVTGCTSEADLWSAEARLDADVLTVLPPVHPGLVDDVGGRIRDLRDELVVGGGIFSEGGPDIDEDAPVRSLAALLAAEGERATFLDGEGGDAGPARTGGSRAEGASDGGRSLRTGESGDPDPGNGPDGDDRAAGGNDFEFGDIPQEVDDGDGGDDGDDGDVRPDTPDEAGTESDGDDGDDTEAVTDGLTDRISDILGSGDATGDDRE